jgi:hypothetical protein
MWSLVYISAATCLFEHSHLADILARARRTNADLGLTGMLLHADGNFMQVLEGRGENVELIYARICRDERHGGIMRLLHTPIERRLFPAWTMAFRSQSDLTAAERAKFGASITRWRSEPVEEAGSAEAAVLVQSFLRSM